MKRDNIVNICVNRHLYAFLMLTETDREGGKEILKHLLFFLCCKNTEVS